MDRFGVFINYRHRDRFFAGRVYDYLKARGLDPFLDDYSLRQGDFDENLLNRIREIPYFLCVLTPGSLDNLRPDDPDDTYYRELETAVKSGRKILLVADSGFSFPEKLPPEIERLRKRRYCTISQNMGNFFQEMETLCSRDISLSELEGVINWREYAAHNSNVFLTSREELEGGLASLNNRFGEEFVRCVKENVPFEGEYRIRHINLSCYAANIIFSPDRSLLDHKAYDYGMMFNIFSRLFEDPDFSMTLIINSPDSPGAVDAIAAAKLGNSSLEDNLRAVFLSSFANIRRLAKEEPFRTAKRERRFRTIITDTILPFAYFQIVYKDPWKEFNHIKLDLYTEGLNSSTSRRSMLLFETDHLDSYRFLQNQFTHLQERSARMTREIVRAHEEEWIAEWNEYLEELE